jgi:hypothetical protein
MNLNVRKNLFLFGAGEHRRRLVGNSKGEKGERRKEKDLQTRSRKELRAAD